MNRESTMSQLLAVVVPHLSKNARHYNCIFFDGTPLKSVLGFWADPKPFDGQVIARTDEAIFVKMGRKTLFAVLDRQLVSLDPEEGDKVVVTPYVRHRFDGERADAPTEQTHVDPTSGKTFTTRSAVLGQAIARLPIPAPQTALLQALVEVLEESFLDGEHRQIAHMLVDAGACDFMVNDIALTATSSPKISFSVSTAKFQGRITLRCAPGGDYFIEWQNHKVGRSHCGTMLKSPKALGAALRNLIDDGSWQKIQVEIIRAARKPRKQVA